VAVLPFSDEVVSLDGPDLIRVSLFNKLKAGGYNVIPLADVTKTLDTHGFSEGGQLTAVRPEKIAEWLNADGLIFGHIEDFNEVNVGVYVKRSIKGKIWMWDRPTKAVIWETQKPIALHRFAINKRDIVLNFLGTLGQSFVERLAKNPLGSEIENFVQQNIEELPLRPG
jgi:hypothetical protein